jgi:hypothetical protein
MRVREIWKANAFANYGRILDETAGVFTANLSN